MSVNHASKTPLDERDSWRTPPWLFAWASSLVGGFHYDAACTEDNALAEPLWDACDTLGDVWIDEDSLHPAAIWPPSAKIWINPPYSDIKPWVRKAIDSGALCVLLIPSPNGEAIYEELLPAAHEIHIVGRIAFIGADGKPKTGNTRGSSLFIVNGYSRGTRAVVNRDDLVAQFSGKKPKRPGLQLVRQSEQGPA
ncbi:MAG: hypothetical protein HYV16_12160 [Gammaproteobacteria bacterium]|nr:hypothetical protein [Gammaproteobacteria bacterium]